MTRDQCRRRQNVGANLQGFLQGQMGLLGLKHEHAANGHEDWTPATSALATTALLTSALLDQGAHLSHVVCTDWAQRGDVTFQASGSKSQSWDPNPGGPGLAPVLNCCAALRSPARTREHVAPGSDTSLQPIGGEGGSVPRASETL